MLTSPKNRGQLPVLAIALFIGLFAGILAPSVSAAEPLGNAELPVLFDTRERLPRPDMAMVSRIRVLTTIDFPPFSFLDETGRPTGFHVDLIREICAELKVEAKCQIQALPYAELEATLEKGAGDVVLAGVAVTPELRQKFSFSRPYLLLPARFAINRKVDLKGPASVALSGRPVGIVAGTAHEAMLKSFFPKTKAQAFETPEAMLEALKAGNVDAVFADGLRLPFWVSSDASASCCTLFDGPYMSQHFLGEGLSVMFRHNDVVLPPAFDSAIAALSRNGRLQEIYRRYFPAGLY